ncbi:MAG: cytochrome c [Agriterribacter sp.]
MKRIKKIAKKSIIGLLAIVMILVVSVAMRQNLKFEAPYPDIHASSDSNIIKRGKHIVFSQAHCADCHSKQNADSLLSLGIEPTLSGGKLFDVGIAKVFTPNLTSDKVYGLGRRTDGEIARVIRYGVHANGNAVLNFMGFTNMSDDDLTAVISYLRTQKAVPNQIPVNEYSMMGKAVKAFLIKPVGPSHSIQQYINPDSSAAYGEYIVQSTTNCAGCHTKRDLAGNISGPLMAGGNNIEGFISPNLTPDSSSRIFGWSEKMFIDRIRMGKLIPQSPMPWNSFKRMTDVELKAVYKYLQSIPAAKAPPADK